MKYLSLIGLLFLCSCSKDKNGNPQISGIPGIAPTATYANASVVFMGQSNSQALWSHAGNVLLADLQTAYPGLQTMINCAVGNTSLEQWQSGAQLNTACLQAIANSGKTPVLLIFWQGEYEAEHGNASTWAQRFTQMMIRFRADLGNPAITVLYARLGLAPTSDFSYWNEVRDQQTSVCLEHGFMVNLDSIPRPAGDIHYDDDGYARCAAEFANTL